MASLIQTYYEQAQLSDAAYADLLPGMSSSAYRQALRDRGFTIEEAADFAEGRKTGTFYISRQPDELTRV